MAGEAPGEVRDLQPAGEARRDHEVVRGRPPQGRKQLLLTDEPRDFIMLLLVSKRSGHPTAARVEVDDLGTRDAPQQPQQRSYPDQRPLVTVPLHENSMRPRSERDRLGRKTIQ